MSFQTKEEALAEFLLDFENSEKKVDARMRRQKSDKRITKKKFRMFIAPLLFIHDLFCGSEKIYR